MSIKFTIKKISACFFTLVFLGFEANATTHTITVSNFQFSPASIPNVVVGDTMLWVWQTGSFGHTTTCDPATQSGNSLPAGAATWDAPMNAANDSFAYKVTVAGTYNYWCKPHFAFMTGSFTAAAAGPLPVKLSQFNLVNDNNNATLKWVTESEQNIDYFSVQKSKTGSDFTEIARIPAAGNSSAVKSYTYTDPVSSSADKFYYYTIAIVDKEGKKEFSSVQLFKNKSNIAKLILSLSPNPVSTTGHLMLKFNADKKGIMNVNVSNIEGRSVMAATMQAYEGVNNGHLMLEGVAAGTYSVSFELSGVREVYKLIVK